MISKQQKRHDHFVMSGSSLVSPTNCDNHNLGQGWRTKSSWPGADDEKPSVWQTLWPFILVLAASCLIFFGALGKAPLFNPDEGLYAEPAREMLETGEYVTTLLNYVVRYTKPPLIMWMMVGAYQAFGVNEFAARFFEAASAVILIGTTYLFLAHYATRRAGVIAAATLATAPLFVATGRLAITDMPLSLFMAGALMSFYHGFASRQRRFKWVGYVLVGLALMTKGPVGAVLPIAILLAYHVCRNDLGQAWRYYNPLGGLLVVSAIAVPWFAYEIYITNGAYYYEFLVRENFQRFTGVVDHKFPWWYHIAAMGGGFFPWTLFLPAAVQTLVSEYGGIIGIKERCARRVKELLPRQDKTTTPPAELSEFQMRETDLGLFALLWAGAVLVFFSVSVSKLLPYTLPAFPALAILVALEIDLVIDYKQWRYLALPFLIITLIFAAGTAVAPFAIQRLRDCPEDLGRLIKAACAFELFIAMGALVLAARRNLTASVAFFAVATGAAFIFFGSQVLDVIARDWEEPLVVFARYAAVTTEPVIVYDLRKPALPFYTRRPVINQAFGPGELATRLQKMPAAYILTKAKNQGQFADKKGYEIVSCQNRFLLVHWRKPAA